MAKLAMVIELDDDAEGMHGADPVSRQWFFWGAGDLRLHSNEIGDTIGTVTVKRFRELPAEVLAADARQSRF